MIATKDIEKAVSDFRKKVPAATATAISIDRNEPWERILLNAVNDGYDEFARELEAFVEFCLRRAC